MNSSGSVDAAACFPKINDDVPYLRNFPPFAPILSCRGKETESKLKREGEGGRKAMDGKKRACSETEKILPVARDVRSKITHETERREDPSHSRGSNTN